MKRYYVWLVMALGAAQPEINYLLDRFGGAEGAYRAFEANLAAVGEELTERAKSVKLSRAEKLIAEFEADGGRIMTLDDELYPERLKNIEDPPCVLFAKGNLGLLRTKLVTAVGSRQITRDTEQTIHNTVRLLKREYTIVSTLSSGCDQFTCLTAIKEDMPFIEIMPCGHYNEYPQSSGTLRSFLLRCGGLTLTEQPPNEKATQASFHKRSRILGGISPASVIFQAGLDSHALNTAEYSDAPLFVPPHNIFRAEYAGAVTAVRSGAGFFFDEKDIETAYSFPIKDEKAVYRRRTAAPKTERNESKASREEKAAEKPESRAASGGKGVRAEELGSKTHFRVYDMIAKSSSPLTAEQIMDELDMESTELEEVILDLVIGGYIKAVPGNKYIKTK